MLPAKQAGIEELSKSVRFTNIHANARAPRIHCGLMLVRSLSDVSSIPWVDLPAEEISAGFFCAIHGRGACYRLPGLADAGAFRIIRKKYALMPNTRLCPTSLAGFPGNRLASL